MQIKYLNNIIESNHGKLKRLIKPTLGLWIRENGGDKFRLNNFTQMKNRGLKDILIAYSDNLTGMSEAISTVYPKMQASVVYRVFHQIRKILAEVSYR